MSKVCVFLAEGFEEIEALTVVDILRRGRVSTDMVSVTGSATVTGSHRIPVEADGTFSNMNFDDTEMLVLPGGMPGTTNLEAFPPLMTLVESFYNEGKYIAAICAAPSIFGHRGMLKGRKACCNPGFEQQLIGAEVTQNPVTVDGHVITSRGMGTAIPFGLALLEIFNGHAAAEEMKTKLVY